MHSVKNQDLFTYIALLLHRSTLHTVMTAGAVAVPTIIPLKAPSGPKHIIDSVTLIEVRSGIAQYVVQSNSQ